MMPDLILRRVGLVLIAVTLIQTTIGVLLGTGFLSLFNVWPALAGIFLIRGNILVASYIRWLATISIVAAPLILVFLPLRHPIGLWIMQFRLHPGSFLLPCCEVAVQFALVLWIAQQLRRAPVAAAMVHETLKPPGIGMLLVVGVGAFLIGTVLTGTNLWFQSRFGHHAAMLAEQQLGPGFRYQVSLRRLTTRGAHKSVSALVTAWNNQQVRQISVHWDEP